MLVEFWDFARVNSLRTLPYLKAWHARYADAGLRVIGVHTPGYSFGRDRDTVARAVERLEIAYPVLLDPDFEVMARVRQPRLAGPLPVRPHRQAALHPLRRGRVRGDRARDPARCLGLERCEPLAAGAPRGRAGRAARAADRRHRAARRARPARAGARLDRRRGLDRGRRRGRRGQLQFSAGGRLRGAVRRRLEPGLYEVGRDGRGGVARACACTACSSRLRRQRLPDLLREHEAHVLLDDLELRDVRRCRARGRSRPAAERAPRGRSRRR